MAANYGIKFSALPRSAGTLPKTMGLVSISLEDGKNYLTRVQDILDLVNAEDIGLGLVDNTPDLLKPVSHAVQEALVSKADRGHHHVFGDVDGLEEHIASVISNHTHPMSSVVGLVEALAGKSGLGHSHQATDIAGLANLLDEKAAKVHSHSLSDINGAVETIQSLWASVNGKADKVHTHLASNVSDFNDAVRTVLSDERNNLVTVDVGIMEW